MNIKVYNNDDLVFQGSLEQFLEDNQFDEWLVEECAKLQNQNIVEFSYFNGEWRIERQD